MDSPESGAAGAACAAPPADQIERVATAGCSVLLDVNDGDRLVFARLSPAATIKIGNKKCSLTPLIGCPFGSLFSVVSGPKGPQLFRSCDDFTHDKVNGAALDDLRDNRALIDNNTAQNLSSNDIDTMRRDGATGDEIIEALIANSSTFEKKTVFSQEKYKLKKQKKYATKVLLRRPCARSVCETYFKKHPTRTGFLRVDTLSLLLSMANVGACSDVLVVDMVGGLVVGAVAERIGGSGHVCSTYFGSTPTRIDIVRMFNFSSDICMKVVHAPFSVLSTNSGEQLPSNHEAMLPSSTIIPTQSTVEISEDLQDADPFSELKQESDAALGHPTVVKCGRLASQGNIKSWKENGFTSLIVASPEMEVTSMVESLLPLLAYSAPFVVYHQYLQPLVTCMHKLQTSKMALSLQISEPWLREYQVLPSRTHPHMQMSAFGGYLLSGIRICTSEQNGVANE